MLLAREEGDREEESLVDALLATADLIDFIRLFAAKHALLTHSARAPTPPDRMEWCLYTNKPCWNLRCVKTNGELHRFCVYHRTKANASQRRWQERRQHWAANTANAIDGQADAAPVKKRKSNKPHMMKEMRLLRKRMVRHQRQAREASFPAPPPEHWPIPTNQAEPVTTTAASASVGAVDLELGQLMGTEDLELTRWLRDEEIAHLLENAVQFTVDPLSSQLVP